MKEIAQQTSPRISSASFSIKTLANEVIHLATNLKLGLGRPLQRFESVQLALRVNELPGVALSNKSAIGTTAPALITRSRMRGLSPAIFPKPQITYSMTSICGDFNKATKPSKVPFPINT